MRINPFKLLRPSYLFDPTPFYDFLYFWPLLILFIASFVGSFFIKDLLKKYSKHPKLNQQVLRHLPNNLRWLSSLGVIALFFRQQNIPYLSMRLWLVLILLTGLIYGVWLFLHHKKELPKLLSQKKNKVQKDKYLPKKKK